MNSYPFTSQVTYDEQGLPEYDRAVDSAFLRKVFAQYFSDGIFYKPTSALQVTVDAGMNIKVLPGVCHIQGAVGIEERERVLAVQASDVQDRIDTVVARLNLSLESRSIDLYVVKGTASESPAAPALTRNSTVWELGLADIFVAKNTATITQQRITDTRLDNSRCGMVAQTIGALDTSPYFEQVQAMISDLEKTIAGIESGSGYVFSLSGKSGHLTLADIGAQPQTAARNTMVKADASGTLVAAGFDDFAPGIQFENPSGMDYTNVWKFPNGLMIVTKTVYLENIAITTATGGFFSSQSQPLGSIPKFVERPYLTASAFGYDNLICWISNLSYKEGDDNKSMLPNIRLASNYSRTGSFYVNVQAIGKWK